MTEIFFPILIISIISIISGLCLSIASVVMKVPQNKKIDEILKVLPGANCGACGFSGCEGYAKALAEGKSTPGLCSPGGDVVSKKLSNILGCDEKKVDKKIAYIACNGTCNNTKPTTIYNGMSSCSAATLINNNNGTCPYGCLGFGDCVNTCKYNAITVENNIAKIDANKCIGCGMCVKTCPKNIIKLIKIKNQSIVNCSNNDKGPSTKKACKVGCLGCKLCEKTCKYNAIKVENNLANIDINKCTGCGECREICPNSCISTVKYK